MTVTPAHFKEQLDFPSKNGYTVIPLAAFVAWRLGKGPAPAAHSVVLTFDDGNLSFYQEARPILEKQRLPVTLFIYPSCISNASWAMTWNQLAELAEQPWVSIESHTYWHPNFKQDAKKRSAADYNAFVDMQLRKSKAKLEERFKRPIDLLAWPFGIYDAALLTRARAAGYEAAFSIDGRAASGSDNMMALPRCLVMDEDVGARFGRFLESAILRAKK
jgi:peptidoglycan/xylan/chitin deacetylase (PgdA/CDA1 family)